MTGNADHPVDPMFTLLFDQGVINLVRADAQLRIVAVHGRATGELAVAAALCDAVPALFGLEAALQELHQAPGAQLALTNVSVVDADGTSERHDYVVLPEPSTGGYLVSITPSLANDELTVELEQNLRKKLHLETRVAAQARAIDATNAALRRTNEDLINFTRMISHDLKAPMRAIRYSAEDIGAALADTEDEMQLIAVDELRQQSIRLSQMVTDLLTYSRLGDKSMAVAPVDTAALIAEIVNSMPQRAGLAIEVTGAWPVVTTVGVLLDVVLRNLIDNAIKHHDRQDAEISVRARPTEDALEIVITDDGPGIPEDYQQAVLRPFVKVKKDQYESSGLGLSMVDKVISDIGGRLELGDRPDGGRGTRIVVLWPLSDPAA